MINKIDSSQHLNGLAEIALKESERMTPQNGNRARSHAICWNLHSKLNLTLDIGRVEFRTGKGFGTFLPSSPSQLVSRKLLRMYHLPFDL